MAKTAIIRPAWTPATIGLMVLGFVVFWPLGLAMLAYILWGDRLDGLKEEFSRTAGMAGHSFGRCGNRSRMHRTGNVAFDDWREEELSRLEEERRKLDEMRSEFDEYMKELRRAKDQKEFDEFMASRQKPSKRAKPPRRGPSAPKTVPDS